MQSFFWTALHMDVFRQRLEDEYNSEIIITAPSVPYKSASSSLDVYSLNPTRQLTALTSYRLTVIDRNGTETIVANPTDFPDIINHTKIAAVEEPMVICTILVPEDYIGPMMELCTNRRGEQLQYSYLEQGEVAVEDGAGESDGGLKSEGVSSNRALLKYKIPMAEIVTSFFDELKRCVVHFFLHL